LGGSDITWTICKTFASHKRQITVPAPHHSIFYWPDAPPDTLPTVSKFPSVNLTVSWLCYFYLSLIIPPKGTACKLLFLICRSRCEGLNVVLEASCQGLAYSLETRCQGLGLGFRSFSKVLITRLSHCAVICCGRIYHQSWLRVISCCLVMSIGWIPIKVVCMVAANLYGEWNVANKLINYSVMLFAWQAMCSW